jgi:hypothetical protein
MGDRRGAYRALMRKPEGRRPLGRPRHRWEDNIKMDLEEVEWEAYIVWRSRYGAFRKTEYVMNVVVYYMKIRFSVA